MKILRSIFNSHYLFWLLLALPGQHLIRDVLWPDLYYPELMYDSGSWSVIFMIAALALTPLMKLTGNWWPIFWLLQRRRAIGVASFGYAALHTFYYVRYVGNLELIILEAVELELLIGWLALVLLIVLAATSNTKSVRKLGRNWKRLQRLSYLAIGLSLLHWYWIYQFVPELTYWAAAIAALQVARVTITKWKSRDSTPTKTLPQ